MTTKSIFNIVDCIFCLFFLQYLLEGNPTLSGLEHHYAPPLTSTDVDWSNLLSVTDLDVSSGR